MRIPIPILRALTSVMNGAARWAGSHPNAVIQIFIMLSAGAFVLTGSAAVYLIWHLVSWWWK
jgi:hypothetical protein